MFVCNKSPIFFYCLAANGSPFYWNWGENYAGSSGLPTKTFKTPQPYVDVEVCILNCFIF